MTAKTSSSLSPTAASDLPDESVDLNAMQYRAREDVVPAGWYVWPLRRGSVLFSALKWGALALIGFGLFIPALVAMVPSNFDGDAVKGVLSSAILVILGAVAFGASGVALHDLWRALRANDYLLVMTPDHYVKFTPGGAIHVPMSEIAYVTMRGVRLPEPAADAPQPDIWNSMSAVNGMFFRGGATIDNLMRRNYRRAPASLAFLDLRHRREVIVATDDAFDALPILEQVLRDYAHGIDYSLLK